MDLVEEDIEPPQSIRLNKTTEEQKLEQKTDGVPPTERNIDKDLQSVKSTKIHPQKPQPAQAATNSEIHPEIYPWRGIYNKHQDLPWDLPWNATD